MDDKINKLQAATDEAEEQLKVCQQALDMAEQQLSDVKNKYRNLPQEEQERLQVNDTELPELIETQIRAKNVYDTVLKRYETNKRYVDAMKAKQASTT
jgi:dsDNA-specific endonuclease/ATPase MutS2